MENNSLQQFLIQWKWRTTTERFEPLTDLRINFVYYRFRKGGMTFNEQTKLLEWLSKPEIKDAKSVFNHKNLVQFLQIYLQSHHLQVLFLYHPKSDSKEI